jgi:alkylation response protein AidB-like acyl-CoA dehydrogenase
MAKNYYSDEAEWKWLFKNAINWNKIIPLYYPEFPTADGFNNKEDVIQFIEEMITATGDWCGGAVASRARQLDEEGAGKVEDGNTHPGEALTAFYNEAKELGILGLSSPVEFGGMGAPVMANLLVFEQINRACISSATQIGFFTSIIDMLERFAEPEDRERLIPQIVAGDLSGSMCLTEPGAGSDL